MATTKKHTKPDVKSNTISQGLARKEELKRVRGYTKIVDPEGGPENK